VSLEAKLRASLGVLQELAASYGPGSVWVAWTGGKDSTATLALWLECLKEFSEARPQALGVDTGLEFAEVIDFREEQARRWGVDLRIVHSEDKSSLSSGISDPLECCRRLKVEPLRRAVRDLGIRVLLTGLRRDEHESRRNRQMREERRDPEHLQVNPLLEWTEMDVWAYHLSKGVPCCQLYEQGYRSLDCRPCTALSGGGERAGRNPDKESRLAALRELGYF
jgi:phosphoadenosine phosphosulfate reductase